MIGTTEGVSSVVTDNKDDNSGTAERLGAAGAADVRGFAIGSVSVGPPEACGTLKIDVSVETWGAASRHTIFLGRG